MLLTVKTPYRVNKNRILRRYITMAFVPTTQSEVRAWLERSFAAHDSLDASKLADIYAKDAIVQFGNMPLMNGTDELLKFYSGIWDQLEMMHHELESFDMVENRIYQSCHITWQVKNDPQNEKITVPGFGFYHLVTSGEEKGKVSRASYYMDGAPLMAALERSRK
ncbi:hypothetical protein F5Y05DRAFT_387238 [Hypoxylon sp. FL0543]|nr:hypothetical protein F5Y05DRAFT_387238 [Hypoxylon sp. FL0543]